MSIQNLFSTTKWNKTTFRIQLARIMQVFIVLVFLTSAVGVNPARAMISAILESIQAPSGGYDRLGLSF